MKGISVLTKDEIRTLLQLSDLRGFQALSTTWGLIVGSLMAVAYFPSVLTAGLAWIILGGRQLALAILMHDAAHYSLFKSRKLNDWLGTWLCAFPVLQDLKSYRAHHMRHHQHAGTGKVPDLDLVEGFPVKAASLRRKFIRDLCGSTGLKRIYGIILMDLGAIQYTVSSRVVPLKPKKPMYGKLLCKALMQLAFFGILAGLGHGELYLLWLISYLTTFSLFIRIRSIAEHACTTQDPDPILNTRTTYASWIARLTVAPHRVNYHLEHHLLMAVPYFNLPQLHQTLLKRGVLKNAFVAQGYRDVLENAVR